MQGDDGFKSKDMWTGGLMWALRNDSTLVPTSEAPADPTVETKLSNELYNQHQPQNGGAKRITMYFPFASSTISRFSPTV